jgi:glyoxylate reductase
MLPRIFVSTDIPEVGLDMLLAKVNFEIWRDTEPPEREYFLKQVAIADGIIATPGVTTKIDRETIDAGSKLRIVSSYSVGYDHIDLEYATEKGIMVTNTPGVLTDATADMAFGLLLASARRIGEGERLMRSGKGCNWGPKLLVGQQVAGSSLGIIGLGRIGTAMAERAAGFGMKIFYTGRSRKQDAEKKLGIKYISLHDLLTTCDFVSIHCPLTPETKGLIGKKELRMMKETAILVNTSRGPVVDQDAITTALKEKWIAGAGLDVFRKEPLDPDDPLTGLENVVLAPHLGSATVKTRNDMAVMAVSNLLAGLSGEVPPNLLNSEVLEKKA